MDYPIDKNQRGFTITEIIVATVIFSLAAAGLYATIASLRKPAVETDRAVNAALVAKRILEQLRSDVDAETWEDGGALSPTGSPYALDAVVLDGVSYAPQYIVEDDPDGSTARKVTITVSW